MLNLSIVIATWNRPEMLRRCLDSIPLDLVREVIVIDDGSDTAPPVMPTGVSFHRMATHSGFPGLVRDFGIKMSSSDYVTIVDDDDWLHPGGLLAVADFMDRNPDADLMSTWAVYPNGRHRTNCERAAEGPAFMGHLVIMRRKLYDDVGGFAPDLPCAVNIHLYFRLCQEAACQVIPFPAYVIDDSPHDRIQTRFVGVREHLWQKHAAGNLDFYRTLPLK